MNNVELIVGEKYSISGKKYLIEIKKVTDTIVVGYVLDANLNRIEDGLNANGSVSFKRQLFIRNSHIFIKI